MKPMIKILSLILALMMLFCSCDQLGGLFGNETELPSETSGAPVDTGNDSTESDAPSETDSSQSENEPNEKDEYRKSISRTREEVEAMLTITDDAFTDAAAKLKAFEDIALASSDVDAIDAVYLEFEDTYYYISTQVSISSIIYYLNMSDEPAYERYNTLYEKYGDMHDSYMESCKNIYNNSPVRDELFADWTEEEIKQLLNFSPESTELTIKNEDLLNELNNITGAEFTDRSAEIYAELVTNNNRIAELAGYDNYYDYATKEIYLRDYGREDLEKFCASVAEYYVPRYASLYQLVYNGLNKLDNANYNLLINYMYDPFDSMKVNYLNDYIESLDGSMKEGMEHAFVNKNMIFTNAPNSHPSAFQTYLDDLDMPFCLFGSEGQSTSTIVHELGHYYASLYNSDLSSYDLAEVQSQGNEMLLLDYLKGNLPPTLYMTIKNYTMYSNITTIISCVIIDEFEREVYALDSVEGFKSADFDAIMTKVCEKYGGVEFIEENMGDMYGYWRQVATNNPVYYISYAVSLTSAMNIYAKLGEDRAAGREMYRIIVEDVEYEEEYLSALSKAGLPSPFDIESTDQIVKTIWGVGIIK